MALEKVSLSIFDILSYLLPGYVVLFALSLVEATFFDSSLFALANLSDYWLISSIMAYFLGQICHRIASFLSNRWPAWFDNRDQKLIGSIYYHIRNLMAEMHSIEFEEGERIRSLETFQLADSYIVASGKTAERDSLMAREGFHKTSMTAFAIVSLAVLASLFGGGVKLQLTSGNYLTLNLFISAIAFGFLLIATLVFWRGYAFFNRLKINNILVLAMTLRTLDKESLEKGE